MSETQNLATTNLRLRSKLKEAIAALEEAAEALEQYADGGYGEDGKSGNKAMRALMEVQETLAALGKAEGE